MQLSRVAIAVAFFAAGPAAQAPAAQAPVAMPGKVKVFILAGQSNMEGKARVELAEYQADAPETKAYYQDLKPDGRWLVRDDVWVEFLGRRGPLTVGFGSPGCIGPELRFGMVVGDRFEEQVLLIKTAWGGKSLGRDFLPPGAPQPSDTELEAIVTKENEDNRKNGRPETTLDEVRARYGKYYRDMLADVRSTLADLGNRFPGYRGQGYEFAGLVWFQGWNDQYDESFLAGYGSNLQHLVRDVRRDLACPSLPVVVGLMGQNGFEPAKGPMLRIQQAQAAIAEVPEFRGNVRSVRTDVFWDAAAAALIDGWEKHQDEWKKVGSDRAYHYLGSVRTFGEVGRAFGTAMLALIDKPAPEPAVARKSQDDAAALALALDAAHRGPDAPAKIESFRAEVRLEPRQNSEEAVTVDLEVEFQAPKSLRAAVREKGLRVEEGNDPKLGAWVRKDGEVTALQGPEHNQAADKVLNELRLCRQVLGFLDPKSLIARMETPSAVRREDLELFRMRYPACRVVEGIIEDFPTYTLGTEARARVTVYVHGETNRLLAVSALPLDSQGKPRELAELIVLDEFKTTQDVLLPGKLNVYRLAGPGKELLVTVRILGIELATKFAADHFKRPR